MSDAFGRPHGTPGAFDPLPPQAGAPIPPDVLAAAGGLPAGAYVVGVPGPGLAVSMSDMLMCLVEWNAKLAETIVAQADQIVALNQELTARRTL